MADSQHLTSHLVSRFTYDRSPLSELALTTNTSAITAIGNDYGYELLFSRQIEALGWPGDVLIGLTTSGRSPNMLRGLEAARSLGVATAAMAGTAKASSLDIVDCRIQIAPNESAAIQEGHMIVVHLICQLIEEQLHPRAS